MRYLIYSIALVLLPAVAHADLVFGNIVPAPDCAAPVAGQEGRVCGITESFTQGTDAVVANGFSAAPAAGTGNAALTLKPNTANPPGPPNNSLGESGLGVNAHAGPPCTDNPDCEISPPQSVTAVVTTPGDEITGALIGSVQAGEFFRFFTEAVAGGPFVDIGGVFTSTCAGNPAITVGPDPTDTCVWTDHNGVAGVAVQAVLETQPGEDVLLSSLVISAGRIVPALEPQSITLLGIGLAFLLLSRINSRRA